MKASPGITYYLRKYPLLRVSVFFFVILVAVIITVSTTATLKRTPEITELTPSTGVSGDVLTIRGSSFGNIQSDSYIELSGERLLTSSYLVWTDEEIQFTLPFNSTDGLVYVITPSGTSNPMVFTNQSTIPVSASETRIKTLPVISSIAEASAMTGTEVTISGDSFGPYRGESQVWFTAKGSSSGNEMFIPCSEFDQDYIFWSDHEIKVRVPDGAATGNIFISSSAGTSNRLKLKVTESDGYKTYSDSRNFTVHVDVSVTGASTGSSASITLFTPRPSVCAWQRSVYLVENSMTPALADYSGATVHQVTVSEGEVAEADIQNTYTVNTWKIETNNKNKSSTATEIAGKWYSRWTEPDDTVPSADSRITSLVSDIIKKEKSPWNKASLIYNWVIKRFELLQYPRPAYSDLFDALDTGYADAYDEAIFFTALARAAGIPAIPDAGVIVDKDGNARNHWWAEFYIDGLGWIPVDPAMGSGLDVQIANQEKNPASFYFGSLDSSHITLSRGLNSIKSSSTSGRSVTKLRSYALQTMWEEASSGIEAYTARWALVAVTEEL